MEGAHHSAMKSLLVFALAWGAFAGVTRAAAPLYDVVLKDIDGKTVKLDAYQGKVLLIVNVASECGYTSQYEGLQSLFTKYQKRGFAVLGIPCNQFGGQEPGTAAEIKTFCSSKFHVTFPLFDKIEIKGPNRHPLYTVLAGKGSPVAGDVKWNFAKFLVGRDGVVLARFDSEVEPDAPELLQAVEKALGAKP
jgi:glutathione peroxidase